MSHTGFLLPLELGFYLTVLLEDGYRKGSFYGDGEMVKSVESHLVTLESQLEIDLKPDWPNQEKMRELVSICQKFFGKDEHSYWWMWGEELADQFVNHSQPGQTYHYFMNSRQQAIAESHCHCE